MPGQPWDIKLLGRHPADDPGGGLSGAGLPQALPRFRRHELARHPRRRGVRAAAAYLAASRSSYLHEGRTCPCQSHPLPSINPCPLPPIRYPLRPALSSARAQPQRQPPQHRMQRLPAPEQTISPSRATLYRSLTRPPPATHRAPRFPPPCDPLRDHRGCLTRGGVKRCGQQACPAAMPAPGSTGTASGRGMRGISGRKRRALHTRGCQGMVGRPSRQVVSPAGRDPNHSENGGTDIAAEHR